MYWKDNNANDNERFLPPRWWLSCCFDYEKITIKEAFSWDKCRLMYCVKSCKTVTFIFIIRHSFPFLPWFNFLFIKYSMHFCHSKRSAFCTCKATKESCTQRMIHVLLKRKNLNQCLLKIDWQTHSSCQILSKF